jgi:hypothetical protein
MRDLRLGQEGDGARRRAEVGDGDERGALGEVAAGVHPAPEGLGLERGEGGRADLEVLSGGLP